MVRNSPRVQIIGADEHGNFQTAWIFHGTEVDVMRELDKYHKQYPGMARIMLDISLPIGIDRRQVEIR